MKPIYQNFDGLEVSFQCRVSKQIRAQLENAKLQAQSNKAKVLLLLGKSELPVTVYETGARGGFTYQFDTGLDGEIWLVRDSDNANDWCVRVRVSSLGLALKGYRQVKEGMLDTLSNVLHAEGSVENMYEPKERVSRIDYCLDYLLDGGFEPSIRNFVCSGRANKGVVGEFNFEENGSGSRIEYTRIGKMPNRQVVIYNKTKEIASKQKLYWWKIWEIQNSQVDEKQIWRVEIRAGKKELNKWNLRQFKDLENIAGDVFLSIMQHFRYCEPNLLDQNKTRWSNTQIWNASIHSIQNELFDYISKADRKEIFEDYRNNVISRYEKLITGIMASYTAVTGNNITEIPAVLDQVCQHVAEEASLNHKQFEAKIEKARNKFVFIGE